MVTRPEELERALEQFLTVESSGWKKDTGTAIALDERLVGFYRALVREFGPRGMCRINVLTLDDQAIAAQFGLISDRQLNLLKIGYSHEHGSVAPGNLIMRDTIEQVCADPALDRLSFVTHPPWSHLWKPQLAPVDYVTLFPETLPGRLTYAAATWLQARRARAAAAAAAADPAGDATAPASDDGGGADMLSGGGHATATGLSPT
jgi:CelD/BcsL family acetyltransferase involved in cellulose biosynthesis